MAYCKLYTNFAAVSNKLKLNIMKQKNLTSILDEDLIYMNWFLEYMLRKNESTNILSKTEINTIRKMQNQIRKAI